ncbi:MAG: hypothetical protein ACLPVW_05640 [Terriglobales bacterium]
MPSAQDIFNELVKLGDKLDAINATSLAIVNDDNELITLTAYTDTALYQNALQNATIICLLEQIAKNTCDLVNQSYVQTSLQETIERNTTRLAEMFAATHSEAAFALHREHQLRQEIEKCCPPKPPAPPCQEKPCSSPKQIDPPPPISVIE